MNQNDIIIVGVFGYFKKTISDGFLSCTSPGNYYFHFRKVIMRN